jgi:ribosomal protein S18 acetylase RimI-like enzyme
MTRRRHALQLDEKPAERDVARIVAGLRAFNERQTKRPLNRRKFSVYVRDGDGAIAGGLVGVTYWDWLYIDYLWLGAELRRRGWGRRLLREAERVGRERGCRAAWLDTFSFQAPGFYRRMGYTEFGRMDEHPSGHARHFLWKRLVRRQARRTPARRR